MSDRIVVAALGDSITAGSPAWDPDPRIRELIWNPNPESQYEYWAARADPRLEFANYGHYGHRTDEIARRLESCAAGADLLILQGGVNDIAQRRTVETAAANLTGMVRSARRLGVPVLLAEALPWNTGWPDAEPAIRRLNQLIAAIGREESVVVLPFYETLEDPARPGRMREEWTSDGDHPSVEGYRLLGELVASMAARSVAT